MKSKGAVNYCRSCKKVRVLLHAQVCPACRKIDAEKQARYDWKMNEDSIMSEFNTSGRSGRKDDYR